MVGEFQSTHPLRGATTSTVFCRSIFLYFNPRTPCGVRQRKDIRCCLPFLISIHAPLAGCDITPGRRWRPRLDFNPRTPCGVRQRIRLCVSIANLISIHAPLAGCDRVLRGLFLLHLLFQSTHPLRGATQRQHRQKRRYRISIHAPLAGCDQVQKRRQYSSTYFNPRTPCGVRLLLRLAKSLLLNFNPRTPCGVRRRLRGQQRGGQIFQSTHPLRGATGHSPARAARARISIHAPLAGCDA